jgi:hypothetical protein
MVLVVVTAAVAGSLALALTLGVLPAATWRSSAPARSPRSIPSSSSTPTA